MANLVIPEQMLETSCGSPHYASPEVIKGTKYDGSKSDVWSFGVILYAMLVGRLPFDDENIRKLLQKVVAGNFVIPEFVSSGPRALIKRMMSMDPNARPTVLECLNDPWVTSGSVVSSEVSASYPSIIASFPAEYQFEPDVLYALEQLGFKNKDNLLAALNKPGKNMEKILYGLLLKEKNDMFENFEEIGINNGAMPPSLSTDSSLTRRTGSLTLSHSDSNRSPISAPPSPVIPKGNATQPNRPSPLIQQVENDASIASTTPTTTDHPSNSPKALVSTPEGLRKMTGKRREITPVAHIKTTRDVTLGGSQSEKSAELGSAGASPTASRAPSLTHHPLRRAQKSQRSPPPSPNIGSTPKVSWFKSVFNFKPEAVKIQVHNSLEESVVKMEELLKVKNF